MHYSGKNMVNRYEQVELFSAAEYRRRLAGVRQVMREQEVDTALFLECSEETADHWLTGTRFLDLMIVPASGTAWGVCMNELDAGFGTADAGFQHTLLHRNPVPPCEEFELLLQPSAAELADRIAAGRPHRIGLISPVNMPAALYDAIMARLPGMEFSDISIPIARFRSVKSDEELYAIRQSRNIQVKVMEALPQIMRLGRTLGDMQHEISSLFIELGATGVRNGNLHYCGPMDAPPDGPGDMQQDHKLAYGDRYNALFEVNGPGHQHIAFERHYAIGEPTPAYAKSVADAIDVHNYAVSLMKPDSLTLGQIAVKTRKYCNRHGLELHESLGWNWMHGMGAFFYDQYALEDFTEDEPLQAGIILHCHPLIYRYYPELGRNVRDSLHLVNTYRITPDGAEDLVGLPKDLIVLYP